MSAVQDRRAANAVAERMYLAISALCLGAGDVRSRLETAVLYHLRPLRPKDFPAHTQPDFKWIMEQSKRYEAPRVLRDPIHEPKNRIKWTMRRIKRRTGVAIA